MPGNVKLCACGRPRSIAAEGGEAPSFSNPTLQPGT